MALGDNTVRLVFRVTDEGTMVVLDEAGRKLGAISGQVQRTAGDATTGFSRIQAGIVTVNQALSAAQTGFAAVRQVVDGVNQSIQQVDGYAELAKSVGLTVTELTELRVAARQGGVDLSTLGRAVGFLQREIVNAADGGGKGALFTRLGIAPAQLRAVRDGTQSVTSVMADLGIAFEGLSKAQQVAFSRELFGRAGNSVLNVLTSDMRDQIGVARQLGAVISDDMARPSAPQRLINRLLKPRGSGGAPLSLPHSYLYRASSTARPSSRARFVTAARVTPVTPCAAASAAIGRMSASRRFTMSSGTRTDNGVSDIGTFVRFTTATSSAAMRVVPRAGRRANRSLTCIV